MLVAQVLSPFLVKVLSASVIFCFMLFKASPRITRKFNPSFPVLSRSPGPARRIVQRGDQLWLHGVKVMSPKCTVAAAVNLAGNEGSREPLVEFGLVLQFKAFVVNRRSLVVWTFSRLWLAGGANVQHV